MRAVLGYRTIVNGKRKFWEDDVLDLGKLIVQLILGDGKRYFRVKEVSIYGVKRIKKNS